MTSFFFWGPGSLLNLAVIKTRRATIGGMSSLVSPSSMYSTRSSSTVLTTLLVVILPAYFCKMESICIIIYDYNI